MKHNLKYIFTFRARRTFEKDIVSNVITSNNIYNRL